MDLIIGGAYQGKCTFAAEKYRLTAADICDLAADAPAPARCYVHLEALTRRGQAAEALPLLPHALEYARMGLIPAGSHLNRTHCAPAVDVAPSVDEAVESIVFDAQTSGGIVLAVPGEALGTVRDWLEARGEMAVEIGGPRLLLR